MSYIHRCRSCWYYMDGGLGRATCWHTWLLHRAWLQRWQRLQGSSQGLGGYAQSWHRCLALVLLLLLAICLRAAVILFIQCKINDTS